jgi:hypothetical protein
MSGMMNVRISRFDLHFWILPLPFVSDFRFYTFMAKKRGSYSRRATEPHARLDEERSCFWEMHEKSTARKVKLACDEFLKDRENRKSKINEDDK